MLPEHLLRLFESLAPLLSAKSAAATSLTKGQRDIVALVKTKLGKLSDAKEFDAVFRPLCFGPMDMKTPSGPGAVDKQDLGLDSGQESSSVGFRAPGS